MLALARMSVRRPKAALAGWLVYAVALALIGFGVDNALSPSITVVPGTQSSHAQQLANAQFGPSQLVPILLEGPKAQLNREGPALVVALSKRPHTRVLSAWDAGTASAGLRPSPNAAMMVVSVDRSEKEVVKYDQPQIERLVAQKVHGPVKAYITGQPALDRALRDASISNLRQTELITVGILFLLLLIGLRAPVAAGLVTTVGATSMLAGFGTVALLGHVISVDPVAIALGSMTGLALGVGFSLLILDRFRQEEHPPGANPRDAATPALRDLNTTGRAVLIGGTAVIVALGLVAAIGPTALLTSLGIGMSICAAMATGAAVVVMPAALTLLGTRVEAFSWPAPKFMQRAWSGLVGAGGWVTRHAVYTGFAATVLLVALAVPALAVKSGPPTVTQLPANSKARIAFTEISRVLGPGWAMPYNVIVVANGRPITTPALLSSVQTFQTQIAKDPTVASVVGPGAINATSSQLKAFGPSLAKSAKISDRSKKDLVTLINGLGQAGAGGAQLQAGLAVAASGSGQLNGGSGQAQSGAGQLHSGLAQAQAGSATLSSGLNSALAGATALKAGAAQALVGSTQLASGLGQARVPVSQSTGALNALSSQTAATKSAVAGLQSQAQATGFAAASALSALNGMSATAKSDPGYGAAVSALNQASSSASALANSAGGAMNTARGAAGMASGIAQQAPGLLAAISLLHDGATQLQAGISQLKSGNSQLADGISRLAGGGGQLHHGLGQLTAGAGALQAGLAQLTGGTGQLAAGLSGGVGPAGQLVTGLGMMRAAVVKSRGQIPSTADLKKLQQQSPGLFNSGYFVLAAVAGAPPSDRNASTFMINLLRGGTAGQIVVVSKYPSSDPGSEALGARLAALSGKFGKAKNAQLAVGGPAGNYNDLTSVTKSKIPVVIGVLAVAIALILGLALRSVLLPIVATAFNLLVAAATFGVLQLLFGGTKPLLGGPGYMDPMSIIGLFTIVFSISVIYGAVLLMRTREVLMTGGRNGHSVRVALRDTAAASTGAGLVMAAALIPFATTNLINVRQFGIGVAVAILIDVLIVRPVLLPAAIAVLGKVGWWPTRAPAPSGPTAPSSRRASRAHVPRLHPTGTAH
jgi:RND superfamily putative drug exporter